MRDIAAEVVPPKPVAATSLKVRTGRQDVKTPKRKDVTLRAEALTHGGRLTSAAFKQLQVDFPDQNLKRNFVGKQLKWYRTQLEQGQTMASLDWSRKRNECGRGCYKFTAEVAKTLIETSNRYWGKLSYKRLAGKLSEQGIVVTSPTVRTWCKQLGMIRRRRYIKPKLTLQHKINRLAFTLKQLNRRTGRFTDLKDVVHSDEKWFYLMKDGQVCRVFPDKNGDYKLPASPKIFHKSRMPKVMILAVCARPRAEYAFDGKVGLWSFTLERPAKRSDIRTGTVVGETMILEDVSVDAEAYRQKVICKDGVFDAMRQKMWWFHQDARFTTVDGVRVPSGKLVSNKWQFTRRRGEKCPEAGQPLHYQHDGARPHTAKTNTRAFASHSKMRGFRINVVVQPAQSPDLNVDDLAFFNSLQSDVSLVAKESRRELLDAVISCWDAYPAEKMRSVWHCLYNSFKGILETGGDNDFSRHRGSRRAHAMGEEAGDLEDQVVSRRVITNAEKMLAELQVRLEAGSRPSSGDESSDSDDDEGDDE